MRQQTPHLCDQISLCSVPLLLLLLLFLHVRKRLRGVVLNAVPAMDHSVPPTDVTHALEAG